MAGFTKLQSSIVHSTIWREPDHVRLMWITMLAICDKNGMVEASVPGLADVARVELTQCEDALQRLASPDQYSRSQEYEGRRIKVVDGGWLILNYLKYRGESKADRIAQQNRDRQKKFRDKNNVSPVSVTLHNANNAQSESESESDKNKSKKIKKPTEYSKYFLEFWKAYPLKKGKGAAYKAWLNSDIQDNVGQAEIIVSINQQTTEKARLKADNKFCPEWPHPATWLNQRRWEDETTMTDNEPEIIPGVSMREQRAFEERMNQNDLYKRTHETK